MWQSMMIFLSFLLKPNDKTQHVYRTFSCTLVLSVVNFIGALLLDGDGCILDYTFYFLVARCHTDVIGRILLLYFSAVIIIKFSNKHDSYLYYTYDGSILSFFFCGKCYSALNCGIFCFPGRSLSCVFHIEYSVT